MDDVLSRNYDHGEMMNDGNMQIWRAGIVFLNGRCNQTLVSYFV